MNYLVILTRDITESTSIVVSANSEDEATNKALDTAGRFGDGVKGWELDEGNFSEVYVTGCDVTPEKLTGDALEAHELREMARHYRQTAAYYTVHKQPKRAAADLRRAEEFENKARRLSK